MNSAPPASIGSTSRRSRRSCDATRPRHSSTQAAKTSGAETIATEAAARLAARLGSAFRITPRVVDEIPVEPSGKFRVVESTLAR